MIAYMPKIDCTILMLRCGGEGGIRTRDTGLPYTAFRERRLQPLGHLSLSDRFKSQEFYTNGLFCRGVYDL